MSEEAKPKFDFAARAANAFSSPDGVDACRELASILSEYGGEVSRQHFTKKTKWILSEQDAALAAVFRETANLWHMFIEFEDMREIYNLATNVMRAIIKTGATDVTSLPEHIEYEAKAPALLKEIGNNPKYREKFDGPFPSGN